MRATLLLSALFLACVATAQEPTGANETIIWNATQNFLAGYYLNLGAKPMVVIQMSGTEMVGNQASPMNATLYWKLSYDPRTRLDSRVQVELDIYDGNSVGSLPSFRMVGDGINLYRYDLNRSQVSTTTYGVSGNVLPQGYDLSAPSDGRRLLTQLRAATPGPSAYLMHLLSDLNPSGPEFASRYTSWDSGTTALNFEELWNSTPDGARVAGGTQKKQYNTLEVLEDDVLVDPLTLRPYVRGTDRQWFFYRVNQAAPTETMAVQIDNVSTSPTLERWCFTRRSLDRTFDLSFTLSTATIAPAWAFAPYTGAQAAAFRPVYTGGH